MTSTLPLLGAPSRNEAKRIAFRLARAVQRAAREITVERNVAARVVVVLGEDVGPPQVETAANIVGAAVQRYVGLNRIDAVPVGLRAARHGLELIDIDHGEDAADFLAWHLLDETRGPELRRVEPNRVVGIAPLQEVGVAGAQVEYGPGAEDVHPVADQRAVGAPERKLAALGGTGADGVRPPIADLVPLVLAPAEEGPVVGAEVVVDLPDPVPEQVLVEVLGPVQVLLPRRHAGRRAVGIRVVLHDRPRRRD